jgi:ATP-dependent Lon protease
MGKELAMRDFRDAKSMAQTLRETLGAKTMSVTHSESLELVARMHGVEDWNTLSASIKAAENRSHPSEPSRQKLPALPIKDAAPFPGTEMPFWLKRAQSIRALEAAHAGGRRIVLVTQKRPDLEQPGLADIYEVAVTGRVLDIGPPAEAMIQRVPQLEGSTQVLVQTHQRVRVRAFSAAGGAYEAEVETIDDGPMREDPELVNRAREAFARYMAQEQNVGRRWPSLDHLHDPGRVADVVAQSLMLGVEDKQSLLATLDSSERLAAVMRHLEPA